MYGLDKKDIMGGNSPLFVKDSSGELRQVAFGHLRIVLGGRGPYVEFSKEQLIRSEFHIPQDQRWRYTPAWRNKAYYGEFRSNHGKRMLYRQFRTVGYADYRVGRLYMSPWDLYRSDGTPLTSEPRMKGHQ